MQTIDELKRLQSQPLEIKVKMTEQRVRQWVSKYGEDGVYISFSGGKDSTVLLDIVRNVCGYKRIPAVFVDVPTQYPELKTFAEKFDNLTVLKPRISFAKVCDKYGFPIISKEVSGCVHGARKYLTSVMNAQKSLTDRQTIRGSWAFADIMSIPRREGAKKSETYMELKKGNIPSEILERLHLESIHNGEKHIYNYETDRILETLPKITVRTQILFGVLPHKEKGVVTNEYSSMYDKSRYKFFVDAPFEISDMCCKIMKKMPVHTYHKDTGRVPFTAQMADESRLRQTQWLKHGCNGFDMKIPMSNPMSFWTENDVLEYIATTGIEICSVYGDIVEDYGNQLEGQISLADYGLCEKKCKYKCTGCSRTGCVLCGYGAHLESKEESRFRKLAISHPKFYNLLDLIKNNGVTFREAIEWTNAHLNKGHIWL